MGRLIKSFIVCSLFALSAPCWADATGRDEFSLTSFYTIYNQSGLSADSGSSAGVPMPSLDFELAIRLQSIFNLTASWSQFKRPDPGNNSEFQSNITGYGLGMKIDMPGFFFLGGKKEQSSRESKMRPINSYLFGEILRSTTTDVTTGITATTTIPRYGFGFDVFLFNPYVYLSFRLSLLNLLGATFLGAGGGLGFVF